MSSLIFTGGTSHLFPAAHVLFIVFLSDRVLISFCRFVWVVGTDLHELTTSTIATEANLPWKIQASSLMDILM